MVETYKPKTSNNTIEAVQFNGNNILEVFEFLLDLNIDEVDESPEELINNFLSEISKIEIRSLCNFSVELTSPNVPFYFESNFDISKGDYIYRINSEIHVRTAEEFENLYEEV